MKRNLLILAGLSLAALLFSSCSSPTQPKGGGGNAQPSTIRGVVIRSDDLSKVPNVVVYDTRGSAPQDTTKSDGSFKLTYQLTSQYSGSLVASRVTFGSDTISFTLAQGANDSLSRSLVLKADTSSQKTSASSGLIASIVLVGGGDVSSISIRGTGFTESALLTFEARDSLGITVGGVNRSTVFFSLLGGPGGGEYVFPASGVTDLTGRVSTRVTSGTKPGVVQVYAYTKPDTANPNLIIQSSPVRLTISGGLPDLSHFSLSVQTFNIAGMLFDNLRDNIKVIIGDKDGNPVQPGTAVYFKSTGGIIQPSAITDKDGTASVSLISGNPRPAGGRAIITATTIGDSGRIVTASTQVIFSGTTLIAPPASGGVIPDSGSYGFNYTVADGNGNPIVGKSTIIVSVSGPGSGDLALAGDVNVSVPDASGPGIGATQFRATLIDKTRGGPGGLVNVTISVTSDPATGNGNQAATFSVNQISSGSGTVGSGGIGSVSNLTLSSITPASGNLSVRGTGSNESARLTFVARDSLGNAVADPIDPTKKVYVTFSISPSLGGGEFIFPSADSTDNSGHVGTTFNAGTRSGVVQVTATAVAGGRTVTAAPVVITISGGLPDANHFAPTLSKVNMAGLVKTGALGTVSVQVGDSAGNPVQAGTKIFFSTAGGLMSPGFANTDLNGNASNTLLGEGPTVAPPNIGGIGHGLVTISTVGKGGVSITKQMPFLFSGTPVILGPSSGYQNPDSGSYFFTYKVADQYGNPLVGGTSITVTKDGPGSGDLELKGDVNVTMPDTKDTSLTSFKVLVQDKTNGGASGEVDYLIKVAGDNGTAQYAWKATQLAKGVSPVGSSNGYPSSIQVLGLSNTSISVKGTGSNETSTINWVVKDSLGNPITLSRSVTIAFTLQSFPGGGEFLYPDSGVTDASGRVSTTVNSGTKSGVVQVVATIVNSAIKSSPAALVISGGLPDLGHVSATLSKQNMAGLVKTGALGQLTVQLGDVYGNSVPAGTAVYFTTNGGVIDASSLTGSNGTVVANISGGNPAPSTPTPGFGFITMETGGTNAKITKQIPFLFSGAPLIVGPASGFQIVDSGQYSFTFKVADLNGNPLSGGTSIAVTASGAGSGSLSLKGDAARTLPDTKDTSFTKFAVQVQDNSGQAGPITFTITVAGDNGPATYSWSGTKLAKGVVAGGSNAGYPSSIQALNVNPAPPGPISVKGTGSLETATMTFQVKDSLGNPLDPSRAANVSFSFSGPGGGEFLFPASATTNANGQVTTTLNAGTKSGVVQVIAQTTVGAIVIKSSPVQMTIASGLADPAHFTLLASVVNAPMTSWNKLQQVAAFSVLIGDRYGNPARATAVYFTSNGGVISSSTYTGQDGIARGISLTSGNPFPAGGIDTVTAITQGENSVNITTKTIITVTSDAIVTAPASLPTVTDGGFVYLNFDVKDVNNNPISAGNLITVTVAGDAANQLTLSGNTSVTTTDTRDTSKVHYQVKIADLTPNGGTGGNFTAMIRVVGPNTSGSGIITSISGFLQAPGVIVGGGGGGGGTGYTSSILLSSVSATDISVQGTGNSETATLVFQAQDSLGQVVDQTHGSVMHFSISAPTLGASLTIDSAQTDASGRATTLVRSGIIAGVIQVRAQVTIPSGRIISSLPVRLSINSGLPDQNHFTIGAAKLNFPGLRFNGLTDAITIQMGDAYGNPVQPGTVAYFTTNHGIIQTVGSTTNSDGFITKTLFSANPRPEPPFAIAAGNGFSYVTVSTDGSAGNVVKDSIKILWTGPPIITRTGGFAGFDIAKGSTLGPWTFTVVDVYNHPMSAGTTVSAVAAAGLITGNLGSIFDTQVGGSGITSFRIFLTNTQKVGGTEPPTASDLIVTVNHPVYGSFSFVLDSGTME